MFSARLHLFKHKLIQNLSLDTFSKIYRPDTYFGTAWPICRAVAANRFQESSPDLLHHYSHIPCETNFSQLKLLCLNFLISSINLLQQSHKCKVILKVKMFKMVKYFFDGQYFLDKF